MNFTRGILLTVIGIRIIVKTWVVGSDEVIRAMIFHQASKLRVYLKCIGFTLATGGIIAIFAGSGIV